ncbi:hypothetical protein EVA_05535 [gut metagenome]|uniref:Uncharacterized protein n=1 Tax=gut metagenome TaxID=749906 RepID=J9GH60_9ZZZZ
MYPVCRQNFLYQQMSIPHKDRLHLLTKNYILLFSEKYITFFVKVRVSHGNPKGEFHYAKQGEFRLINCFFTKKQKQFTKT